MTNTLHRYGDRNSFRDDYIVFAMCSRGKNDENAVSRLRQFLDRVPEPEVAREMDYLQMLTKQSGHNRVDKRSA